MSINTSYYQNKFTNYHNIYIYTSNTTNAQYKQGHTDYNEEKLDNSKDLSWGSKNRILHTTSVHSDLRGAYFN